MTDIQEKNFDVRIIPAVAGEDRYIIYRPLAGLAFVGNRAMVDLVLNYIAGSATVEPPGEAGRFLRQIGFLQPDPSPPEHMKDAFHPTTAVLLLTNQCQLRCTYCYAAAGTLPKEELSVELAYTVIDYVCRTAEKLERPYFDLALHGGGEPTYVWSVLKECVAYARSKEISARISLTSNGVWSPAQRHWITKNLDGVSLSIDGAPETQDQQRPLRNGRASSPLVMETVAALDKAQFPYGIRLTATPPFDSLPDDIAYLCSHSRCRYMQVEPAFNISRGGHGEMDEEGVEAFINSYLAAHELAVKANRQLVYTGARLGDIKTTFCTAPFLALIVNPSGDLVTCYEVTGDHSQGCLSHIGRVVAGEDVEGSRIQIDHQIRRNLHSLMAERREACRDCFCYWSCAGDCYMRTFVTGPNGHLNFGLRCQMNRRILAELLLDAISQGDGVWQKPRLQNVAHTHNRVGTGS
ncbi:MAG: radical SAM protein [Anaerolineales bacterium]|jgi:uncharacterized protein